MLRELLLMLLGRWISPSGVAVIGDLLEAAFEIVEALRAPEWGAMTGSDKRWAALTSIRDWLDEHLDDLTIDPLGWGDLSEDRRDRILTGLIEITLWIIEIQEASQLEGGHPRKSIIERLRLIVKRDR